RSVRQRCAPRHASHPDQGQMAAARLRGGGLMRDGARAEAVMRKTMTALLCGVVLAACLTGETCAQNALPTPGVGVSRSFGTQFWLWWQSAQREVLVPRAVRCEPVGVHRSHRLHRRTSRCGTTIETIRARS